MQRTSHRLPFRAFAAAALLVAGSPLAWAHAALTKSEPRDRAVLSESPPRIHLQFNERVEAKFSTVSLEDAQGNKTALPTPVASGEDAKGLDVAVPAPLADGRYSVKYRVLSQDGHVIERAFAFTIAHEKATTPPPATP